MSGAVRGNGAGRLVENIMHFARVLRAAGLRVGPGSVMDAIAAVEAAGIGSRRDFYWALHASLVKRPEDNETFDQAFRVFWRRRTLQNGLTGLVSPPTGSQGQGAPASRRVSEALIPQREDDGLPRRMEFHARLSVSERELLQRKDFEQMSAAEIAQARALIARLVLPVDTVKTRRLTSDPRGRLIDMRRSMRASLRSGGGMIDLKQLDRTQRHPPLVAICDISGSMTQYSRMFLHFLHALQESRRRVSSFVFGTRLTNITRHMSARDPDAALARCSQEVADWAGGTRISACLRDFNRNWGRRVLGQGAVVLLATDGLEREGNDDLAFEMDRLHRSCRRLIWLNPLLRFDRFEAKAKGILAMLPHVDEFRPAHNMDALVDLVVALDARTTAGADPRRWLRKAAA